MRSKAMDDNLVFKRLVTNKPDRDFSKEDFLIKDGSKYIYVIFDWMSLDGKEHRICSKDTKTKEWDECGLTQQIFYDFLILQIDNTCKRPKCPCGNELDFRGIITGYRKYCSEECKWKYKPIPFNFKDPIKVSQRVKGRVVKDSTRKLLSENYKTGKKTVSINSINALVNYNKSHGGSRKGMKTPESTKEKQRAAALSRISKDPQAALKNYYKNRKTGKYKPNKSNKPIGYLSSWELEFMKLCDKNKQILRIDSIEESIPYNYDGKDHLYIPDLKLTIENLIVIVEIKPAIFVNDSKVIAKRLAGKLYCRKNGYKYITLTEKDIFKKGFLNIYDYIV